MAVLVGILAAGAIQAQNPGRSADLDQGSSSFGGGSVASSFAAGSVSRKPVSPEPKTPLAGVETTATHLWEQVVLVPTSKSLGLIASERTFDVEVWNTYRRVQWGLPSVSVAGVGGLTISGVSLPAQLPPIGSQVFTATIPEFGAASINNTATFHVVEDRTGGSEQFAPVFLVTGLRITLFPFSPDWSSSVKERTEYMTDRFVARSGMEQRRKLRMIPRRGLAFALANLDPLEAQTFDALLFDRQSDLFAVPWWPDQARFIGTLVAGATAIAIDTTNRLFSLASMVVIWSSWDKCEVQTVESVSDGLVTCSAIAGSYTNPIILPAFPGRLPSSQDVSRVTSRVSKLSANFSCEVGVADERPSPATPVQVYGFDLLDVVPNWEEPKTQARRIVDVLDDGLAAPLVRDRGSMSFQSGDFRWFLDGRAQVQSFRDFFDRRSGSLVPFWAPTWREDMTLAQPTLTSSTGIVVNACGYTSRLYPSAARRYIAIRNGQSWIYRKVTSASSAGATETLTLDATVGAALSAGTPVSFLVLSRLDDDVAEIEWSTDRFGQSTMRFVELPKEVPA